MDYESQKPVGIEARHFGNHMWEYDEKMASAFRALRVSLRATAYTLPSEIDIRNLSHVVGEYSDTLMHNSVQCAKELGKQSSMIPHGRGARATETPRRDLAIYIALRHIEIEYVNTPNGETGSNQSTRLKLIRFTDLETKDATRMENATTTTGEFTVGRFSDNNLCPQREHPLSTKARGFVKAYPKYEDLFMALGMLERPDGDERRNFGTISRYHIVGGYHRNPMGTDKYMVVCDFGSCLGIDVCMVNGVWVPIDDSKSTNIVIVRADSRLVLRVGPQLLLINCSAEDEADVMRKSESWYISNVVLQCKKVTENAEEITCDGFYADWEAYEEECEESVAVETI